MSLSVVQWSRSAGEQCVLCTVIMRMLLDHIRIIVHMDISCIIFLYTPVSFYFVVSFTKLLDLFRTKPLLVIFAEGNFYNCSILIILCVSCVLYYCVVFYFRFVVRLKHYL